MRRLLSVILLCILTANLFGVPVILMGWKIRHNQLADIRLDNEVFSKDDLITLRVPLTLPYVPDQDFQRATGHFQYKDEFFRIFQLKYSSDTITVICIRDHGAKQIHQAFADFTRTFSDGNEGRQPSKNVLIKSLCEEYIPVRQVIDCMSPGWCRIFDYSDRSIFFESSPIGLQDHPPQYHHNA